MFALCLLHRVKRVLGGCYIYRPCYFSYWLFFESYVVYNFFYSKHKYKHVYLCLFNFATAKVYKLLYVKLTKSKTVESFIFACFRKSLATSLYSNFASRIKIHIVAIHPDTSHLFMTEFHAEHCF